MKGATVPKLCLVLSQTTVKVSEGRETECVRTAHRPEGREKIQARRPRKDTGQKVERSHRLTKRAQTELHRNAQANFFQKRLARNSNNHVENRQQLDSSWFGHSGKRQMERQNRKTDTYPDAPHRLSSCRNSEQAKPSTKTDNQRLYICRVKKSCEKTQMTTKLWQNDQKQRNRNTQEPFPPLKKASPKQVEEKANDQK